MNDIYTILILLLYPTWVMAADKQESICYGTTEKGKIENAWQLPNSGANYSAYSFIGTAMGRNYVHSKVYNVILGAYQKLANEMIEKVFVYGETGWKSGGRFRPHKTHQNGLSVDFFVPVLDANGKSVPQPTSPLNKFGYNIEFTAQGKYEEYTIDFESMAAHLMALKEAAEKNGIQITKVIFDNDLQQLLFKTKRGAELQAMLPFSTKKPWVKHDEHYHIDFTTQCKEFR